MKDFNEIPEMKALLLKAVKAVSFYQGLKENWIIKDNRLFYKKKEEQTWDLDSYQEIAFLGMGKSAIRHWQDLKRFLNEQGSDKGFDKKLLITKHNIEEKTEIVTGGHPFLNENSLKAGQRLTEFLTSLKPNGLLVFCLSGGSSALTEILPQGLSLEERQNLARELIKSGMNIERINEVRASVSVLKGGGLPLICSCHDILTLVETDIPSGEIQYVGSGPTSLYESTYERLKELFELYLPNLNSSDYLKRKEYEERLSRKKRAFESKSLSSYEVLGVSDLLSSLRDELNPYGTVDVLKEPLNKSFSEGLQLHLTWIKEFIRHKGSRFLVTAGELPVEIEGQGVGGRNSHFVVSLIEKLFIENTLELSVFDMNRIVISSMATDGDDGNSGHGGGLLDFQTVSKGIAQNLFPGEFLRSFNSGEYLKQLGVQFENQPGQLNLMDLRVVWIKEKSS